MHKNLIQVFAAILMPLVFAFVFMQKAQAQLLGNKLTVYTTFVSAVNHGEPYVQSGDFIAPSLFANLGQSYGFRLGGTYKIMPWLAPGLHLSTNHSSDWQHGRSDLYRDAAVSTLFAGPSIRVYSPNTRLGFFNRFSVFAEIAAGVGRTSILLADPIMTVGGGGNFEPPLEESSWHRGVQASLGAKFGLSPMLGLHVGYSWHNMYIEGVLFNDRTHAITQLEFGLHFRFLENKRFYY